MWWGIFVWALFGLAAGAVAKFLYPGKDPGGLILTCLLGLAGAVVGGFIGSKLGFGSVEEVDFRSFLMAVGGSLLLLFLYNLLLRRR
jgi:uncharacterized membrane protein YeaQ/YmgE (transglycosylase-associated protein family)